MSEIEEQQNNPLHGLKLETLLTQLVEFYGWEILATALRFNCFKVNPNIKGSLKFLRNTQWAREKLEDFYLYRYTRMPRPTPDQYDLAPRERGFKNGIVPRKPMQLTVESIELSQAKAASAFKEKQNEKRGNTTRKPVAKRQKSNDSSEPPYDPSNPWNQ
ncbi:VF530 family DNA-binding protein [Psychromonas sp. MME2]|uniref:VF530 family protein n=1 Tax=unclassified Psychromonas TaxID=2614957 RepID=UPI00339D2AF4